MLDIKIDSKPSQVVVAKETSSEPVVQPQVDQTKLYELEAQIRGLKAELSRYKDRFSELEASFQLVSL